MTKDLEDRSRRFSLRAEEGTDSLFADIPRVLHFIWLGGELPARLGRQSIPPLPPRVTRAGWWSPSECARARAGS